MPPWLLKRSELRKIYNSYALATEKEAALLTVPTEREKIWIPDDLRLKRAEWVALAKTTNAAFVEALLSELPHDAVESVWKSGIKTAPGASERRNSSSETPQAEGCEGEEGACERPRVLEIKHYEGIKIGSQAYASMGSLFLHLFRDWSSACEHVNVDVYQPIVQELRKLVPVRAGGKAPTVMLPGAGLGRLAYEIAKQGYEVPKP